MENHKSLRIQPMRNAKVKSALAPVDHNNKNDGRFIPRAPQKPKSNMKTSKRKKIFGSIYKRKEHQIEKKLSLSDIASGEVAGFVTVDNNHAVERKTKNKNETMINRSIRKMRKRKETQTNMSKRQRLRTSSVKKTPIKNNSDALSSPSFKMKCSAARTGITQQDTATEISALTMASPQALFGRMKAREEMRRREMLLKPQGLKKSQSDLYTRPDMVICPPKSASNDYALTFQYSSSSCSSSEASEASESENFEEFSLQCEQKLAVSSDLSSQSSDCSSSESSGSLCSASTLPPECYETKQSQTFETVSSVAKSTRDMAQHVASGIHGVLSSCFAPEIDSPLKKSNKTRNYLCTQRAHNSLFGGRDWDEQSM